MAKRKIVFLSRYVGVVDRGVETYVIELSKRLNKIFEVQVFSKKDADNINKIVDGKFNIVIPTNGRSQTLKVFLAKFFSGFQVIIPGQAGVGRDDIWNILVTQPDVYIALTDYEKEWAEKFAWRTKVVKIPNGVDLEKFKYKKSDFELGLKGPVVLSVGALEWYKHHELSIKAISKLENVSLVISGKGSQLDYLNKLGISLLGKDRFKIISTPFDGIPDLYRASDLFVLPSWIRESFGIVYVEAMASGLGVVAPNDKPRQEIIGQAGILVNVENEQEYAKAIREALEKKWGDIPRKQAEKFSWDLIAERYKDLISSL